MKLVPCAIEELGNVWLKKHDNYAIIKEFAESGLDCAKVENWHHKNASSAAWSLRNTARVHGFMNIKAVQRKDSVFLVRIKDNE